MPASDARVLILAAGEGKRLRPHTAERPKALVPWKGHTLLQRQLAALAHVGLTRVTVVGGHGAAHLPAGLDVALNPHYATTNMVATLMTAADRMQDGQDVVIAYGDLVYEPRVLESLLACDAEVAVAVDRQWQAYWQARMDDPLADAESLRVGADGRLVELGRKPRSLADVQGQYMGLVRVRGDAVARLKQAHAALDPDGLFEGRRPPQMFMTAFLQHLIDAGWDVRPAWTDGGWLEFDSLADLACYERLDAAGDLRRFHDPSWMASVAASPRSVALDGWLSLAGVAASTMADVTVERICFDVDSRRRLPAAYRAGRPDGEASLATRAACARFLLLRAEARRDPKCLNAALSLLDDAEASTAEPTLAARARQAAQEWPWPG